MARVFGRHTPLVVKTAASALPGRVIAVVLTSRWLRSRGPELPAQLFGWQAEQ